MNKSESNIVKSVSELVFLLAIVFLIRTFVFGLYVVPTCSMETTMLVGERFFADKTSYWLRKPRRGEIIAFNSLQYAYADNPLVNLFERYVWGPINVTKRVIGVPGDRVRGAVEDGKPVVYVNDKKLDEPYINNYPIIRMWSDNPRTLRAQAEQEVAPLVYSGSIPPGMRSMLVAQRLESYKVWRSYDVDAAYDVQPFYRIRPDQMVLNNEGRPQMLHPGTLLSSQAERITRGNSYWNGSDEFYMQLGPDEYWGMGDNRLGSGDSRFFGPIPGHMIHGRIIFRLWSLDSDESWWIFDMIKQPIDFFKRLRWRRFFQFVS